jgi:hypothetical protein
MKKSLCLVFSTAVALLLGLSACTKKNNGPPPVAAQNLTISNIAAALKTTNGKTASAYEVNFSNNASAIILVVGEGKLEKSSPCPLVFDDAPLMVNFASLQNHVAVVSKGCPVILVDGMTPAEAKSKCTSGQPLELPADPTPGMALSPR